MSTEFRVSKVRYDAAIPDELFDPEKLPQASKHPLWTPGAPFQGELFASGHYH